ncbi:Acetyltransferase, GNAT family [Paucilactobacillus wasatchensis]|uniref:Acetyltransferase, GNAT family n=1 Tax=Paucilactobacillus wasatchensis TaxID=1335616 RepID=A0A0D0Y326_9LACO|nr:Acetyltransferase, GNAT family [Paucilactobacillus wasatchensis]
MPLMSLIYDEMELTEFESVPDEDPQQMIRNAYERRALLGYIATTLVADVDGEVVGMAFAYQDSNETAVNRVYEQAAEKIPSIRDVDFFADPEAFDDEFYLDSLAVDDDYRGMGIATKLIQAVAEHAVDLGYETLGLNVDTLNPLAEKLYRRLGFEGTGQIMIGDHEYRHLQVSTAQKVLV